VLGGEGVELRAQGVALALGLLGALRGGGVFAVVAAKARSDGARCGAEEERDGCHDPSEAVDPETQSVRASVTTTCVGTS
jgi:hypothetical protein